MTPATTKLLATAKAMNPAINDLTATLELMFEGVLQVYSVQDLMVDGATIAIRYHETWSMFAVSSLLGVQVHMSAPHVSDLIKTYPHLKNNLPMIIAYSIALQARGGKKRTIGDD